MNGKVILFYDEFQVRLGTSERSSSSRNLVEAEALTTISF